MRLAEAGRKEETLTDLRSGWSSCSGRFSCSVATRLPSSQLPLISLPSW